MVDHNHDESLKMDPGAGKKQRKGASGVVIGVLVGVGIFAGIFSYQRFRNRALNRASAVKIEQLRRQYKKDMAGAKTIEEEKRIYEKYASSLQGEMSKMGARGSSPMNRFLKRLNPMMTEIKNSSLRWYSVVGEITKPEILDFTKLGDLKELKRQRGVVLNFKKESTEYRKLIKEMKPALQRYLNEEQVSSRDQAGFWKGFNQQAGKVLPAVIPFLDVSLKYGDTILALLELLEQQSGKWRYKEGEMIFDDGTVVGRYNNLMKILREQETLIQKFAAQMQ